MRRYKEKLEIIKELNRIFAGPTGEEYLLHSKEKFEAEVNELQQKQLELETDRIMAEMDPQEENDKINVILEFMDDIGVERDYCPFDKRIVDDLDIGVIDNQISDQKRELKIAKDRVEMYSIYYDFMHAIFYSQAGLSRKPHNRFISSYEFFIDICYLNQEVEKRLSESGDDEYAIYHIVDNLSCISAGGMLSVGHPDCDPDLENGIADRVAAICRVAWELYYLEILASNFEKSSFSQRLDLKRKYKSNPIFGMWSEDTKYIEQEEDPDDDFCRAYRAILPPEKVDDINYFIKQFRKGLFL